MITSNELTKAIESVMNGYQDLSYTTIERSVNVNYDTARMPWIGIYPGNFEIDPATLGADQRRWRRIMHPVLVLQEYSFADEGQDASEKLDNLIEYAIQSISGTNNTGLTFGLTGVRLTNLRAVLSYEPMNDNEEGDNYFPQCEITLDVEVRE